MSQIIYDSIKNHNLHHSVFVLDRKVYPYFIEHQSQVPKERCLFIEQAEQAKSWEGLASLMQFFYEAKVDKTTQVVALGGGAILDLVGFGAAIFKRGVKVVFVPTTLLAMVDASIGGKNGINAFGVKNLIGTIKQPQTIFIDPTYLDTLPKREYLSGIAEILKIALVSKCSLFSEALKSPLTEEVIKQAIELKVAITQQDLYENSVRHVLNFGHTVGHAYESCFLGSLPHGYAVALGMLVETALSYQLNRLDWESTAFIHKSLKEVFDPFQKIPFKTLAPFLHDDKKSSGGHIYVHILEKIGQHPRLEKVCLGDLEKAYESIWM